MNILRVVVVALVTLGLALVTGGSGPSTYGLLTPLLPVSTITGHSGLLTVGLTGAALLKLKAAAAIAYWLSVRKHKRAHKGWGWKPKNHHHHHHHHHHHPPKGHHHHPPKGHHHHHRGRGHGWGWKGGPRHRRRTLAEEDTLKSQVTTTSTTTQTPGNLDPTQLDLSLGTTTTQTPGSLETTQLDPSLGTTTTQTSLDLGLTQAAISLGTTTVKPSSDVDLSQFNPSLDEVLQFDQLGCGMRLVCELSATPHSFLMEDEKLILDLFGRDGKVQNVEKASRGKLSYNYAALLGAHAEDTRVCSSVYGRCPYSAPEIMFSLRDVAI